MEIISAVANKTNVVNAEFVKLTIYNDAADVNNTTTYTFSSSYKEETINGQVYTPLGGLLGVGTQQRDIRVTSADTSITLSGVAGDNIFVVLSTKIKGSILEIHRGFYDENYVLASTAKRFTGVVTSYNISEQIEEREDKFSITLNASSYKTVLSNRIAGRKTNDRSWREFHPADSSMLNIQSLSDQMFDFGKTPTKKASVSSAATTDAQASNTGYQQTFFDGG